MALGLMQAQSRLPIMPMCVFMATIAIYGTKARKRQTTDSIDTIISTRKSNWSFGCPTSKRRN